VDFWHWIRCADPGSLIFLFTMGAGEADRPTPLAENTKAQVKTMAIVLDKEQPTKSSSKHDNIK